MADEEILKEESIKDSLESEDIASKINPQIKILKNIGMKQPENVSNGSIIIQENEAEIKENKGIITVKSKDIPVSKKPKKETEWNINYKQLFYSYQIIIAVLILLFGILLGSLILSPYVYNQNQSKSIKQINVKNRNDIFVPFPVFTSDGKEYIIEHFEGNNYLMRKWWKQGDLKLYNKSVLVRKIHGLGKNALGLNKNVSKITGIFGAYLGLNADRYKSIEMLIYGFGKDSGNLEIDLYDDDNGNNILETDYIEQKVLNFDDVFKYNIKINWKGWKKVVIPFKAFKDGNPLIGDDIYNVSQKNSSGGLIAIELIVKNHLKCLIDSIKLI